MLALVPRLGRRDLRIGGTRVTLAEFVPGKPMSQFAEAFATCEWQFSWVAMRIGRSSCR